MLLPSLLSGESTFKKALYSFKQQQQQHINSNPKLNLNVIMFDVCDNDILA